MIIELKSNLHKNPDSLFTTHNAEIYLDGQKFEFITGFKMEIDAKTMLPKVELNVVPTDMKIKCDGKVFITVGNRTFKCIEEITEGDTDNNDTSI
jgi:hypothetical protein